MLLFLVLLFYITGCSLSADNLCIQILTVDCDTHYVSTNDESVCATNGVTYKNCCHFAQAKCKDEQIAIQSGGQCSNTTISPNTTVTSTPTCVTIATTTVTTTTAGDPLGQLFCSGVATGSVKCPDELDPFCGTDGEFYLNNCHFEKARCKDSSLSKQPIDMCKGSLPNGKT